MPLDMYPRELFWLPGRSNDEEPVGLDRIEPIGHFDDGLEADRFELDAG